MDHANLLDADAMTRLAQMEVIATRIVEGFVSGKHRSPYHGSSVEFAEHRAYSPGDEVRLNDWRVFARRDRYYIKRFEEETNVQALLVVDTSGSMAFGQSTMPKLRYAQMAAACLARLMLHQRDAVGLAVLDTQIRSYIPPRSRPGHFRVILEALADSDAGGETSLAALLHELANRIKRRGMIMIFSDGFDDVDALLNALHHLRSRGHELLLFHTLAPEELSFPFDRWSRFECLETRDLHLELDPPAVRKRYLGRLGDFLDRLKHGCGEIQCDYAAMTTDRPLGDTLTEFLARRSARMKVR